MRFIGTVAAIVVTSFAAGSIRLAAQAPTLEPRLSFEVASVKVNTSRTRAPMQWQPGGHFVATLPALSLVSIGYQPREMDVYTLTLSRSDGKLGPGLRRSDVNCDQVVAEARKRIDRLEMPTEN